MPETCEIAPVVSGLRLCRGRREHLGGEFGGPEGDFVEVAMCGIKIEALLARFSLALRHGVSKWSKQQLPFGRVTGAIRMGMGVCWHEKRLFLRIGKVRFRGRASVKQEIDEFQIAGGAEQSIGCVGKSSRRLVRVAQPLLVRLCV